MVKAYEGSGRPRGRRSVELSKAMAHALRHDPERYGIELDREGWVAVEDLLAGLRRASRRWRELTRADVEEMVSRSAKRRFELDGDRVRALYGHSVRVRIAGEPRLPPPVLYHGTTPAAAATILAEGLRPMRRQYVHLSVDVNTAVEVGQRRTRTPVVLRIAAREAARAGTSFWPGTQAVWLVERVEARFVTRN
jgi:putative RNA 2'-phosphotransferase